MIEERLNNLFLKLEYLDDLKAVQKAYMIASKLHEKQIRDDGLPYITHPIEVAANLASLHADKETICAALLHDTLEDTSYTKQDIENEFGSTIANLVDGVTKEKDMYFKSKTEKRIYNQKKLLKMTQNDVRVMIIKIADRMHNISTLDIKEENVKLKIANETLNFYVPITRILNMNCVTNYLEDQSFKHLDNDIYTAINIKLEEVKEDLGVKLLVNNLKKHMNSLNIKYNIKVEYNNIYTIYKNILENRKENYYNIYIIVQDKFKDLLKDLENENIIIMNNEEYLNMQYGIAACWFNSASLQENFERNELNKRLVRIKCKDFGYKN